MTADDNWRERRQAAAEEHVAAIERRRAAESEAAGALLQQFVEAARQRGVPTSRLRARSFSGRATYRTSVVGWYLKRNRSVAVDVDGRFYVMSAPNSVLSLLTGATVSPTAPPLVVGAGGRDGESIALERLLALRLEAGADWPS